MLVLIIIALGVLVASPFLTYDALAIFNKVDFQITNFGLKDGNPYIQVQGKAGGSYSTSCGDECYYAYVYVTDKGTFASTVANDDGKPYYGTDHFENRTFKIGDCIVEKTSSGKPQFSGNTAEYIPKNLKFNTVSKAYTIEVSLDDPDDSCKSGEHVDKVFSSK